MTQRLWIGNRLALGLIALVATLAATLKIVSRALVLKAGRLVFDGPSRELERTEDLWALF